MTNFEEILKTNSFFDILSYCKSCVNINKNENNWPYATWSNGEHIVGTYLDGHPIINDEPEILEAVVKELNDWLSESKSDELAGIERLRATQ